MRLFLSYSRRDRKKTSQLAALLDSLGHDVVYDQVLIGGEQWWARILTWIEECDMFIFALSPQSLESKACQAELGYATALNKPILPLRVHEDVPDQLPSSLRDTQWEDALRVGRKSTITNLSKTLTLLHERIGQDLYLPPNLPPKRPVFPFPNQPKDSPPPQDMATMLAKAIQVTLGRLSPKHQLSGLLVLVMLLLLLSQAVVALLNGTTAQIKQTELVTLLWLVAGLLGALGYYRGWYREVLGIAGTVLGLFIISNWGFILKRLELASEQRFFVESIALGMIALFAYSTAPNTLAPPRYRGRSNRVFLPRATFQESILGAIVGFVNGYLLFGSFWWLMDKANYPLDLFKIPLPETASYEMIQTLPMNWLQAGNSLPLSLLAIGVLVFIIAVIL